MNKILIFSAGRSDFGLLLPIINFLKKKHNIDLAISSQHLDKRFGCAVEEIKENKIKLAYKNKELLKNTELNNIFSYFSKSTLEYFFFLKKKKPKAIFVLGDRYEVYSFVIPAYFLNIPVIHMHGGELSFGAFDDGIRHSISKFSNLHFVINDSYKKRLINMGENPKTIFNFGSTATEKIKLTKFIDKKIFYKKYQLKLDKSIVITFHPETRSDVEPHAQIKCLLKALSYFNNYNLIFTASNSDTQGIYFNNQILKFKIKHNNVHIINNMGQKTYWNFLKNSSVVVGNSSSGIIEAPSIGIPTLNIGNRQLGRIYSKSIFHSRINKNEIIRQLNNILKKKKIKYSNNFYKPNTAKNIAIEVGKFLKKKIINKKFYDIKKLY
jgi:GDP/UDP-N,N'-diacetylbacillosamine 2-epimerase (hydrolysing)